MYATFAVLLLGAIGGLWWALTYNALINARNAADQAWSNVEVELKRRFDLIDNLVAVVKGYARYESQTLRDVVAARNQLHEAHSASEANQTHAATVNVLKQLVALVESYPQLRADAQFRDLGRQLTETEDRIALRRGAYNQTVNLYRDLRQSFPTLLIDRLHSLKDRAFFDAPDDEVNKVPTIRFT